MWQISRILITLCVLFKSHIITMLDTCPFCVLDEVEALYASPDHPVFELVPQTFHERADLLYLAIGQLEITRDTFWDMYLELLKQLWNGQDEELANIISSYQ